MPEGPETRRTADNLESVLLNQTVVDFAATARRWQEPGWCERVIGARVDGIETHGKNLLIFLSNDTVLYSHLMMWGRWRVFAADTAPPQDKRVRAWLRTDKGLAVLYNGPVFEIMDRADVDDHHRLTTLGPDVLAAAFDRDEFLTRLGAPEVAEMELGEAHSEARPPGLRARGLDRRARSVAAVGRARGELVRPNPLCLPANKAALSAVWYGDPGATTGPSQTPHILMSHMSEVEEKHSSISIDIYEVLFCFFALVWGDSRDEMR